MSKESNKPDGENLIDDEGPTYQRIKGFYGELGGANNAQIFYLQCGIRPEELARLTLVSEIPGAECWSVRDLFQREVDTERVTTGILPYLQNRDQIKFFNPLTLAVLPIDAKTSEILNEVPMLETKEVVEGGNKWTVIEWENYYRFMHLSKSQNTGRVEWDDSKVKIVAIDGQHRLSALKRLYADVMAAGESGNSDFKNWTIPVIIFGVRRLNNIEHPPKLLDVIRSIFIYINTAARVPNRARQILLSDESINSICTQELLEYSHENDIKDLSHRNASILPLLFYDWRGEEKDGRPEPAPACLKNIEEICGWFEHYICGPDFKANQAAALGIQPTDPLNVVFTKEKLVAKDCSAMRKKIKDVILPGFCHFLENFAPYQSYVNKLRALEANYMLKSDLSRHAFFQLRFGSNRASNEKAIQQSIRVIFDEIVTDIVDLKNKVPQLLSLDIGMRGVIYAYGELRKRYNTYQGKTVSWLEYTKWFTNIANQIYTEGWFDEGSSLKKHLRHVTTDHAGAVCNYRLDEAESALGALISIVVCAHGRAKTKTPNDEQFKADFDRYAEALTPTLLKGYRRELRPDLLIKYPLRGPEFNAELREQAEKKTESQLKKLRDYCDKLTS